jgi:hypothetical protein
MGAHVILNVENVEGVASGESGRHFTSPWARSIRLA